MITTTIYDEDVEWTFSGAATFNAADNSNPHTGLIDLKATTSLSADQGQFKSPTLLNSSLFVSLSIWIEKSGSWSATTSGVGFWWTDSAGNQVGNAITIKDGTYGFSVANAAYQNVVIPMADFAVPAGTQVQFLAFNTVTKTNLSYFLDTIVLTSMSLSCDPSSVASAAICFEQCVPDHMSVRSLLLSQFVPCTPSGGGAPIIGCNAPGAPTNLVASNVTSSGFTVTWQSPAGTSVSSYTIIWSQFALLFTPAKRSGAAMVSGSTLSYAITGLQPSTTYYVEVIAYNGLCQSNASSVLSQTTNAPVPCTPGALTNAWVAAIIANGGIAPSMTTQCAVDALYNGLATDGIDVKMGYVLPMVPDSLTAALTPLYRAGNNGNALAVNHGFVLADLTVNGLKGDGATKYIDTGVLPAGLPYTDGTIGLAAYISVNPGESVLDLGMQGNPAASEVGLYPARANGTGFGAICNETAGSGLLTAALPNSFAGYQAVYRTTTTRFDYYYASSTQAHSNAGTDLNNGGSGAAIGAFSLFVFNENNKGTGPFAGQYSSKTHSFDAVTLDLSAAQSQMFYNRIQTFRKALGGGFV